MGVLRIGFMGTPDFATTALKALVSFASENDHEIVCVYSQPPRPKGRGQKVQKSSVHDFAESQNIPVFTPINFKEQGALEQFVAHDLDIAIVAAYGLLLPENILNTPRFGCINIHGSLLPRWRGASPIQHAIWKGDAETGVTIMQMDKGLDTGAMILKESTPITPKTTAASLHDDLADMGGRLMIEALETLAKNGALESSPQDNAYSNYAPLLKKSDGEIDWNERAENIHRQIRALNPWPGVRGDIDGAVFKILEAAPQNETTDKSVGTLLNKSGDIACGGGTILRLQTLQPAGKRAMDFSAALNGGYVSL